MKIALVYLGRRGAGLPISFELTRHLAESDEILAVLSHTAAAGADWKSLGVETMTADTYYNLLQAVWSWIGRIHIRHLAERINTWKPDVLLFPMFYTWNPFLQTQLKHIPSVIAVHDPLPHPGINDKVFQWMEDRSIHQSTRCLVFSQSLQPELAKRGCSLDRIDVISLGMFPYTIKDLPYTGKDGVAGQKIPTLLFFGRITAYKGLSVLLKAYQHLQSNFSARLLVVGDGDLRPYRSLIEATAGVEVVNRWIPDEEIAAIFTQADVVILPYTSASQSGVIPIAANFSLPVIATRTGGIPEQIEHEVSGLLVDPGNMEQLSAAMKRLLVDPALRARLGQRLHTDFQQKHSWKQITAKVRVSLGKACDIIS